MRPKHMRVDFRLGSDEPYCRADGAKVIRPAVLTVVVIPVMYALAKSREFLIVEKK